MIGAFLDSLFSSENLKKVASFIFIIHIIIGIILGEIIGEDIVRYDDFKIIGTIIGFLIGGGIGLTEAFIWHILGQILDYLDRISYNTNTKKSN